MPPWKKKQAAPAAEVKSQETVVAATNDEAEEPQYPTGLKLTLIMVGLMFAAFLTALDISIIATAIPSITVQFHSTPDIGWYAATFTLAICSLQPLVGKIFSVFPMKSTFLIFTGIFMIGSLLCALSNSSNMFIGARAVAGVGAAGIFSGAMTIIRNLAPLHKVSTYMGVIMAVFGTATIIGPLLGGVFTQHLTWRWCFYINLPIGAITIFTLFFFFDPPEPKEQGLTLMQKIKKLDLIGCSIFVPAIFMILLALQWGGNQRSWDSATIVGLFCGFGGAIALFGVWEHFQGVDAMIPSILLTNRNLMLICLYQFCLACMSASIYFLPEYFQAIRGASPTHSGVLTLPAVITQTIAAVVAGGLMTITGYFNPFMLMGAIFFAIANGLYTLFTPTTPSSQIIGFEILHGIGSAQGLQSGLIALGVIMKDEPNLLSVANGLMLFFQYLGMAAMQSIALTVFQNLLIQRLTDNVGLTRPQINQLLIAGTGEAVKFAEKTMPEKARLVKTAYNDAITSVFWMPVAACIVGFLAAICIPWINARTKPSATLEKAAEASGGEVDLENRASSPNDKSVLPSSPRIQPTNAKTRTTSAADARSDSISSTSASLKDA